MEDYPGYLGYGDGQGKFIVAVHADWPTYPCPPGGGHALFDLAQLPHGTMFDVIDDIDRCLLMQARNYGEKNPAERDRFYVAAWHEDLVVLAEEGLISGIHAGYERDREQARRRQLRTGVRKNGWVGDGDPLDSLYWSDGTSDHRLQLGLVQG